MVAGCARKPLILLSFAESQFSLNINGWGCHMVAGCTRKSRILVGLAESQFSLNTSGWGCHMVGFTWWPAAPGSPSFF